MGVKKIIVTAVFLFIIIIVFFIPFKNETVVTIHASLYDVAQQINDLNNWNKWNTDFKNDEIKINGGFNTDQSAIITSGYSYTLHHLNPVAVLLVIKDKDVIDSSFIEILPVSDSITNVIWSKRLNFYEMMKRNIAKGNSAKNFLSDLKNTMEDPDRRYGFLIKTVPVQDSLILTIESDASATTKKTVSELYHTLDSFIQTNKLPAEKKYFYTTQLHNNSIAVGIPVYKQSNDNKDIKFLQLPANGRLVEGDYSGKLADKQSIYTAINRFILDHHLKQVAQPLEQYNVADTIPGSHVNIKIYYPVF